MLPLGYLRALGVAPAPAPVVAEGPLEELLADYRRYLSFPFHVGRSGSG
jgi:hypothetical protein